METAMLAMFAEQAQRHKQVDRRGQLRPRVQAPCAQRTLADALARLRGGLDRIARQRPRLALGGA